jgi:hypothetical protein
MKWPLCRIDHGQNAVLPFKLAVVGHCTAEHQQRKCLWTLFFGNNSAYAVC